MTRRPSIGLFLGAMIVVAFVAMGLAVALPHQAYIRYQSFQGTIFDRLGWIYERIAYDETPIDVLVIGSSRSARGANAEALEAALAARGVSAHVANLSMPASGFDARIAVLREAVRYHPEIKLVVWGLVEAFPRDGHQTFADLADTGEILSSPLLVNRNLPGEVARLPYRQLELWLATAVPDAFGYQQGYDPNRYLGPLPDHRAFDDPDFAAKEGDLRSPEHAAALAAESRMRRHEITWPILPEALSFLEFGVSRHYVRELAELGEAQGFDVAFLFLPFFDGYDAPLEADWLAQYGPVWSADFLKDRPENYADAAHASSIGITRVTPWLADQITPLLKD